MGEDVLTSEDNTQTISDPIVESPPLDLQNESNSDQDETTPPASDEKEEIPKKDETVSKTSQKTASDSSSSPEDATTSRTTTTTAGLLESCPISRRNLQKGVPLLALLIWFMLWMSLKERQVLFEEIEDVEGLSFPGDMDENMTTNSNNNNALKIEDHKKPFRPVSHAPKVADPAMKEFLTQHKETTTISSSEQTYHYDKHYSNVSVLGLFEWEWKSLEGLELAIPDRFVNTRYQMAQESCHPPPGVSRKCCLGTYAGNVQVLKDDRYHCAENGFDTYHDLKQSVDSYMYRTSKNNHLHDKEEPLLCDVCRIVDLALEHEWTITFLGDATSLQVFNALSCELHRRNYRSRTHLGHQMNCTRPPGMTQNDVGFCPLLKQKVIEVQSDETDDEKSMSFRYFFANHVPTKSFLEEAQVVKMSDILIMNFGKEFHIKSYTALKQSIQHLLEKTIPENAKHNDVMVMYRESSAQHYNHSLGGDWSFFNRKKHGEECAPINTKANKKHRKWRQQVVRHSANAAKWDLVEMQSDGTYPVQEDAQHRQLRKKKNKRATEPPQVVIRKEMIVLPFYDFTKPFHNMHPHLNERNVDCTTFCSSPYLFMPIWRSLRLALERRQW